jgi:nitroreductase
MSQGALTKIKRAIISRLPTGVKEFLRKVQSSNGFLGSVYFSLFSRRFYGEHRAVLSGRLRYYEDLKGGGTSSPQLRRNIHRLEKGLVMKPRRDVFAERYILETVQAFQRARATPEYSVDELRWASDVLEEYFSVVSNTTVIQRARAAFGGGDAAAVPDDGHQRASKPYPRSNSPAPAVSFEDLHKLFVRRRSVRWYLQEQVPGELIYKAIDAAAQAPSACNRQPFRFIVSTQQEWATRIAECAGGTAGYSQQLPAIIVIVGDLSAYPLERDRHLIYIDASLATMQLMLAAETLGLSTCPINWPDVESAEQRIRELLKLPPHERVVMLLAIGYGDPESGVPYSQKKQSDLLVTEFSPE